MPRSATELLDDMRQAGLSVEIDGEKIGVTPAAKVTAAIRDEVTRHRDEILTMLAGDEALRQTVPPVKLEGQALRDAWAKLNAERERQAAIASREAERRRERQRFEAAQRQWRWEDEEGRRRRQEDLDTVFEAGDGRSTGEGSEASDAENLHNLPET